MQSSDYLNPVELQSPVDCLMMVRANRTPRNACKIALRYFTKSHLVIFLATLYLGVSARGQERPDTRPPEYQGLYRWLRYGYEINSSYPYLKELPEWSKIPNLLEWMNRENDDAGIEVAHSQLVALSRADFGHPKRPPAGGLPADRLNYHRNQRSEAWAQWWESVGKNYGERLHTKGRQNPEAWKLVTRDSAQPLPGYKVTIPDEWVLRTTYRAGDWDGMQSESLTLRRSKEKATLTRTLRKSTRGRLEWERWEPLTLEQADTFAFALAYVIDNPWLLKPKSSGGLPLRLEGRNLTRYHAGFRYEFADLGGNLWWNDDPWHWYGAQDSEGNFMRADGILGSVCLLLWRTFPDNSSTNVSRADSGGWRPKKRPDAVMLQQLAEDLTLRGEIINTLWHHQRLAEGLEALEEFGTAEQLPAIRRLEAEFPVRVGKVASLLAKDPNGRGLIQMNEGLLRAAAKAREAIQKRSDVPK